MSSYWHPLPRVPGMTDSPCYGCEDRSPTCHAECEKFKAWEERQAQLRADDYKRRYGEAASWAKARSARKMKWERNHKSR